jgi:aromatic-L-amino-acid/L-tryptophan decarboxylase
LLDLSPDEMRELGREVMEWAVSYRLTLADLPALRRAPHADIAVKFHESLPAGPSDPRVVLRRVIDDALPFMGRADHPRYFAFVPGPANFVGIAADMLVSAANIFAGTWLEGSGPGAIELQTISWLAQLAGMPVTAGGLFTSGGSMANLTALHAARECKLGAVDRQRAVVYCSDQTHSSIDRGLRILGFLPEQVREIETCEDFTIDLRLLDAAIAADRAAGRLPFCLISNAGTTNTGAVDPLERLADVCDRENLWHHVDGALGAGATLSERGRRLLRGLGRADSFSVDPHKWMFQPYVCGCVIVRDKALLKRAFSDVPDYMEDADASGGETNFWEYGPELTRPFRALKLWMSLQVFGADAFAAAIERGFELAETAERVVRDRSDWRVCSRASMGVVTFRYQPANMTETEADRRNRTAARALTDSGYAAVLTTRLRARTVIRMCTLNPRTTDADIAETIARLDSLVRTT